MKKALKIVSVIFCCMFILGGCKKQDSQALILDIYESWKQMNMDVWVVGPSMVGEEIYILREDDEVSYVKIEDEELQAISDIKRVVEEVCTKSGAEKMFYHYYLIQEGMYYEEDGILYRRLAEIPANYGGELVNFKVLEEKKDYIHAKMEFSDSELESSYTIDIVIVMENGKWLVDNLEQEERRD